MVYVRTTGLTTEGAIDVFKSTDNRKTWWRLPRAFRQAPSWAASTRTSCRWYGKDYSFDPNFWAPQVYRIAGRYVMYFVGRNPDNCFNQIGAATAPGPEGPWTQQAVVVSASDRSVIDPQYFVDPHKGTPYLLYKSDPFYPDHIKNPEGHIKQIRIVPITSDGLRLAGSASTMLTATQDWEHGNIEAPSLEYYNEKYYLFYSGSGYKSNYAVGVARASSPTALFDSEKNQSNPILRGSADFSRPGGQDVLREDPANPNSRWLIFYHADPQFTDSLHRGRRYSMMDYITWSGGWPKVNASYPSR